LSVKVVGLLKVNFEHSLLGATILAMLKKGTNFKRKMYSE
jgi:hypothetical protein